MESNLQRALAVGREWGKIRTNPAGGANGVSDKSLQTPRRAGAPALRRPVPVPGFPEAEHAPANRPGTSRSDAPDEPGGAMIRPTTARELVAADIVGQMNSWRTRPVDESQGTGASYGAALFAFETMLKGSCAIPSDKSRVPPKPKVGAQHGTAAEGGRVCWRVRPGLRGLQRLRGWWPAARRSSSGRGIDVAGCGRRRMVRIGERSPSTRCGSGSWRFGGISGMLLPTPTPRHRRHGRRS